MLTGIVNFLKGLFGIETTEVAAETTAATGTYGAGESLASTVGTIDLEAKRRQATKNVTTNTTRETSSDDGFATSLAVAAATDSALLGFAAGGSLAGAVIGDALAGDSDAGSSSNDSASDSGSSDSGSSYDSGSSDSGSFDSGGGSDF